MRKVTIGTPRRPLSVLAIGAHADDIEIGCGGTILRLVQAQLLSDITWLVLGATGDRAIEAERSASVFGSGVASMDVRVSGFRDGFFPTELKAIKESFEHLKPRIEPDLIFTHRREDLHQDHRLTAELTWNTFRNHMILEYEIPKFDGDLGPQNFYVELTEAICARKTGLIMAQFPSQAGRDWFTEETFRSLLRLRGIEARASSGYAEAFTGRKIVL